MSNVLLPTLPGLTWNTKKTPELNTGVQRSVNLSELRASFSSTPVWNFTREYELLRDDTMHNELQQLLGFFLARYGAWDSWLFLDADDGAATLMSFGTGDGGTTAFQLKRSMGVFSEAVSNIAASPSIYKAGVLQTVMTDYAINATGLVTFVSAPANGAALTWSGTYYFRCRFKEDMLEFEQFMSKLWDAKTVEFIGSLGTKI